MTTGRPLSDDALTIWTAARVMRGQITAPAGVSLGAIRADLHSVSEEHNNQNLAAIAGSAARANPFVRAIHNDAGQVVSIQEVTKPCDV